MAEFLETWGSIVIGFIIGLLIIALSFGFYLGGPIGVLISDFLNKAV